jgi:hypothetical protein
MLHAQSVKESRKEAKKLKNKRNKLKSQKRKNLPFEKSYNRRKSNYTGSIYLNPKPKDFTSVKEQVEGNPGRRRAQYVKTRRSYYRASSNKMHKSFGSEPLLRSNNKLQQKYNARAMHKSGTIGSRAQVAKDPRKQTKNVGRFKGNMALQPKALQRDYNAIKSRTQRNPGMARAKSIRAKEARMRENTAATQQYQGNILISKNQSRLNRKYHSQQQQQYSGSMKARQLKATQNERGLKSAMSAQYSGDVVLPSRRHKQKEYQYASKMAQNHRGKVKTPDRVSGNFYTRSYSGELRQNSKKARQQHLEGVSRVQTEYAGGVKVFSKRKQDNWYKRDAKAIDGYRGNLITKSKKARQQEIEGKAMAMAEYSGNVRLSGVPTQMDRSRRSSEQTNYRGSTFIHSQKDKERNGQYHSKQQNLYSGNIKIAGLKRDERADKAISKERNQYQGEIAMRDVRQREKDRQKGVEAMAKYQGQINLNNVRKSIEERHESSSEQANYEGGLALYKNDAKLTAQYMSKIAMNYRGDRKMMTEGAKARYYRDLADKHQTVRGNYRLKYRWVKDLEEQIISARVHNYQGGPKTSLFTRLWLQVFDESGDQLKKVDNRARKPKYDTREAEIWW